MDFSVDVTVDVAADPNFIAGLLYRDRRSKRLDGATLQIGVAQPPQATSTLEITLPHPALQFRVMAEFVRLCRLRKTGVSVNETAADYWNNGESPGAQWFSQSLQNSITVCTFERFDVCK